MKRLGFRKIGFIFTVLALLGIMVWNISKSFANETPSMIQRIFIHDSASGELLYQEHRTMPEISLTGNRMKDCLEDAVKKAKEVLVPKYRRERPYAFAQIDCRWKKPEEHI